MTTTEELAEKLRTGRVLTTDEGSPLQEAAARLLEQEQGAKMRCESITYAVDATYSATPPLLHRLR